MGAIDVPFFSLVMSVALLAIPVGISCFLGLGLIKNLVFSFLRMSVQLMLIGIFLKYLFLWHNPVVNVLWLILMILVAVYSAVKSSSMQFRKVVTPVFFSFSVATFFVIFYLNSFVIHPEHVLDARYLVVLGGMLLGNSLRGNIVGIDSFYSNIRKDVKKYLYTLSLGATKKEAVMPYFRESVVMALKPTIAAMATMGIVSLPGMMTGAILGGLGPEEAIKYQIVIMAGILTSTTLSVVLSIVMTLPVCFSKNGVLKEDLFL